MWAWLALVSTVWEAQAEPWPDLDPPVAEAFVAALAPGDVLLRWCASCDGEYQVVRVLGATRADGLRSVGEQIRLDWAILATGAAGSAGFSPPSPPTCAVADGLCVPGPVPGCASDLGFFDAPNTWRLDASGAWMPLLVGGAPGVGPAAPLPADPAWTALVLACPGVRPPGDLLADPPPPQEIPAKRKSRRRVNATP